jgi:hypothetical protein
MRHWTLRRGFACIVLAATMAAATGLGAATRPFTTQFPIEGCDFKSSGANPYFKLTPGRQAYFSNQRCVAAGECEELNELWITVTDRTRDIQLRDDGVTGTIRTRVVQEFETVDGELGDHHARRGVPARVAILPGDGTRHRHGPRGACR